MNERTYFIRSRYLDATYARLFSSAAGRRTCSQCKIRQRGTIPAHCANGANGAKASATYAFKSSGVVKKPTWSLLTHFLNRSSAASASRSILSFGHDETQTRYQLTIAPDYARPLIFPFGDAFAIVAIHLFRAWSLGPNLILPSG